MAQVMSETWSKDMLKKMIMGKLKDEDYNRDMNVLFVKLHILDPKTVLPMYQYLLNLKGKI